MNGSVQAEVNEMNSKAFWISPKYEVIQVNTTHIDVVINNPEHFGLNYDYIKTIYDEEHEAMGCEGSRARKRIIINLIQHSWIRIRQYPKHSSWTVNVSEINEKQVYVLNTWASEMINSGVSQFDEVVIDLPERRTLYSMIEIAEGKHLL